MLESPTVWSECMCDRKKSRAPPALRTLQKSTAMGVPAITVPLMAAPALAPAPPLPAEFWRATPRRRRRGGAGRRCVRSARNARGVAARQGRARTSGACPHVTSRHVASRRVGSGA